jgi:aspartyl-tRNA(Asn)/glutamyl-tRNA(Gln) amidotransferase subunit A
MSGSLVDLIRSLRTRQVSPREVIEDHLRRLEALADLNAFRWADGDQVLASSPSGEHDGRPLFGVPIALKDNVDTAGIPTTSGSMVDLDRVPDDDAAVWKRLHHSAGAVLLGKAHLSEFAYRAHHPAFGPVHNPRDTSRASGGSSSGSAVAVAAGIVPLAIGTDTGGSVRIPAAYCGIVGFKPTLGLVDTTGLVPLSQTMDHLGVLARSVTDAAIGFQAMAPSTPGIVDPATLEIRIPRGPRPRVGIELGYLGAAGQRGATAAWNRAAALLESVGCDLVEIRLPEARRWRSAHKTILIAEAWDFHRARLQAGAPYGPVFRNAIGAGSRISARRRASAYATRRRAMSAMQTTFELVDVILTPTCPSVAPPLDEGVRGTAYTRYTTLAAFAGLPAISVPAGLGHSGLPVGVQLMGPAHGDGVVLRTAILLEELLGPDARGAM